MKVVDVLKATSRVFGVSVEEMCMRSRRRNILQARQVAMYILREYGDTSYAEIGRDFDDRNHATVLHGVKKIKRLLAVFSERIERILAEVNNPKGRAMNYTMQWNVELRCVKCQDRLNTNDIQATCQCRNLKVHRLQEPLTGEISASIEVEDEGTVEVQRRDEVWVSLLDAVGLGSVMKRHIGRETEALMRRAIDYWELTRVTHKKKADLMPPLIYWKQYNMLILGFPRISGNTTAALKIATERGLFAYVARDHAGAERVQASWGGKGVYTSPERMGEDLQGLEPMTFVFDGVIKTPVEWDRMLNFCLECASAMDYTEVLILRVGEAL